MDDRDQAGEARAEAVHGLGGEGDLRHEHDRAAPVGQGVLHGPQVDLGFAGAGHAVQQEGVRLVRRGRDVVPLEGVHVGFDLAPGGLLIAGEGRRDGRHEVLVGQRIAPAFVLAQQEQAVLGQIAQQGQVRPGLGRDPVNGHGLAFAGQQAQDVQGHFAAAQGDQPGHQGVVVDRAGTRQETRGQGYRRGLLASADQLAFGQRPGDAGGHILAGQDAPGGHQGEQGFLLFGGAVELPGGQAFRDLGGGRAQLPPAAARRQGQVAGGGHVLDHALGAASGAAHPGDRGPLFRRGQQDLQDVGPAALAAQAQGDRVDALGGDRQARGANLARLDAGRGQNGLPVGQAAFDQGLGGLLPGLAAHGLVELAAQQRAAPPQQAQQLLGVVVQALDCVDVELGCRGIVRQRDAHIRAAGQAGREEQPQARAQRGQRLLAQPAGRGEVRFAQHRLRIDQLQDRLGLLDRAALGQRDHDPRLLARPEGNAHQVAGTQLTGQPGGDVIMKGRADRHVDGNFGVGHAAPFPANTKGAASAGKRPF